MRAAMKCLAVLAFFAAVFVACSGDKDPDKVVGVILKCEARATTTIPLSGDDCNAKDDRFSDGFAARSRRIEVTVKPASGAPYTVAQPPQAIVRVGDTWPPK